MSKTLSDMVTETASYVKFDLADDDGDEIANRIKSAINEAKNILAQRYSMTTSEDVTLDENSCFDTSDLTETFWGLRSVNSGVKTQMQSGLIWCDAAPGEDVSVEYDYIPADLAADGDVFPFPDGVSWRIPCYYAAARYYEIKGSSTSLNKYRYWMNEFESAVNALRGGGKFLRRRIKAVYNMGD